MTISRRLSLFLAALTGMASFSASAGLIAWTDWTAASGGTTASGIVNGIGVTYSGLYRSVQMGATATDGDTLNRWTEGTPAPYTGSSVVDNAPTASELITLNLPATHTIWFDSPVMNPVMAILSMGRSYAPITYDFVDQPFTVLSEGQGFYGDGTFTTAAGDILTGREMHGVIQFTSATPISSITWTSSPDEDWHGFTIGVPVPEPSTALTLLTGFVVVGLLARRNPRA